MGQKGHATGMMGPIGYATGMAGEFFVMERLFRWGHEPALTLGNAKSIDIIVSTNDGKLKKISVKSVREGGKWAVGKDNLKNEEDLIFVFLLYKKFDDLKEDPDVWVMKATDVEEKKKTWLNQFGIYYDSSKKPNEYLSKFKDAWHIITD
jgi:hypothetical protein